MYEARQSAPSVRTLFCFLGLITRGTRVSCHLGKMTSTLEDVQWSVSLKGEYKSLESRGTSFGCEWWRHTTIQSMSLRVCSWNVIKQNSWTLKSCLNVHSHFVSDSVWVLGVGWGGGGITNYRKELKSWHLSKRGVGGGGEEKVTLNWH